MYEKIWVSIAFGSFIQFSYLVLFKIGRFWRRSYSRRDKWYHFGWHCFWNIGPMFRTRIFAFNFYKRWGYLYLGWTWTPAFLAMSIGTIKIILSSTSIHSNLKLGHNIKKKKNRLGVRRLNFRRSKVVCFQEIKSCVFQEIKSFLKIYHYF